MSDAAPETNPDLVKFYRERINAFGFGYQAMWGDPSSTKSDERFSPLMALPIGEGDILVDIGCGTGDLAGFLRNRGNQVQYIGVDAVPEFCSRAREATGAQILEFDAFRNPDRLPPADWYVTFGTLNKSWSVADLPGDNDMERILGFLKTLFSKARKGVAASLITDIVEYRKAGVCNLDPIDVVKDFRALSPHFMIYHGYSFYEYFAAVWRSRRG